MSKETMKGPPQWALDTAEMHKLSDANAKRDWASSNGCWCAGCRVVKTWDYKTGRQVEATDKTTKTKGGAKAPSPGLIEHLRLQKSEADGTWFASLIDGPWEKAATKEEALYLLVTKNLAWFNLDGMTMIGEELAGKRVVSAAKQKEA